MITGMLGHFFLWSLKLSLGNKAPSITLSRLRILFKDILSLRVLDLQTLLEQVTWIQQRNHSKRRRAGHWRWQSMNLQGFGSNRKLITDNQTVNVRPNIYSEPYSLNGIQSFINRTWKSRFVRNVAVVATGTAGAQGR